jgi:cell division protein FtsL
MINLTDQGLRDWISKNSILFLLILSVSANVYQYKEMIKEKDRSIEHEQKQKEVLENILKRLVENEKNNKADDTQK